MKGILHKPTKMYDKEVKEHQMISSMQKPT